MQNKKKLSSVKIKEKSTQQTHLLSFLYNCVCQHTTLITVITNIILSLTRYWALHTRYECLTYAGHSTDFLHFLILLPSDLILIAGLGILIPSLVIVFSAILVFIVRTTQKLTDTYTESHTDKANRYTHVT